MKNWKKCQEISSFYTSVPKIITICYRVPEIWYVMGLSIIFHSGLFFALLYTSLTAQKIKIKKKRKKHVQISWFYNNLTKIMMICYTVPEIWHVTDVIIFHFGPFFALFSQKLKFKKNLLEISSFYNSVPKIMIICYTVPEIQHVTDVIAIFHFGPFFTLLPPNSPKNQKFWKNERNAWRYHRFTYVYQKLWSDDVYMVPKILCVMYRWTDRKSDRGGCPT